MVGNGNFAFTADITGLQTFQEQYSPLVPLITAGAMGLAQLSEPARVSRSMQALKPIKVRGKTRKYPSLDDWDEAKQDRTSSGCARTRTLLAGAAGPAPGARRWQAGARSRICRRRGRRSTCGPGGCSSSFVFDGEPVEVETSVHPDRDLLIVRLRSRRCWRMAGSASTLKFPGVSANR